MPLELYKVGMDKNQSRKAWLRLVTNASKQSGCQHLKIWSALRNFWTFSATQCGSEIGTLSMSWI